MRISFACLILVACVDSSSVVCGDVVCPAGTTCAAVTNPDTTVCALPAQLDACTGKADHQKCHTDAIADGRCYSGVCLAIGCGNGRVDAADPGDTTDVGEVCDDGNQAAGDGCSADCLSNETCGNGVIDLAAAEQCDDGNRVDHDGCDSKCGGERVHWQPSNQTPFDRTGAAMAYDSAHRVVVMFGGQDPNTNAMLADTWLWDGFGWFEVTPPESPPGRSLAGMAYDPKRHRVVLFGGDGSDGTLGDTWEWDGARWTARPTVVQPAPRSGLMMTYDGARKKVVLYGGTMPLYGSFYALNNDLRDTWAWDGTTWTLVPTAHHPGPDAAHQTGGRDVDGRGHAMMAFDPQRGVTVLFGGDNTFGVGPSMVQVILSDNHVWELDATDWTEHTPGGSVPPARILGALMWDAVNRGVVLFGGFVPGSGAIADTWTWNGTTWTPRTPASSPSPRYLVAAASDVERGRGVVFGGVNIFGETPWEWTGSTWNPTTIDVPRIKPGLGGERLASAYDMARNRLVVVDNFGDTYERANAGWHKRGTLALPAMIVDLAMAFDALHGRTVLLWSFQTAPSTYATETWLWNGSAWMQASPNNPPSPRASHAMATDANGHVVLFGGSNLTTSTALDDTWIWDGASWIQQQPAHRPPARTEAVLAYDPIRRVTVLFGGFGDNGALGDTWTWDGSDWTQVPGAGPTARVLAGMMFEPNRGRMMLFGGSGGGVLADTWELDASGWTPVLIALTPLPRYLPLVFPTPDGSGMLVMGGNQAPGAGSAVGSGALLRWQGDHHSDVCVDRVEPDPDGDGLVACADEDCWYACAPSCVPGPDYVTCATSAPHCGDGACDANTETCRSCPADCGACTPICGDGYCDSGETCPGDCP